MAIQKVQRHKTKEQDAKVRARNFDEVSLGFDLETAKREAARCLNCKNAPCKAGCPVSVGIPEFLSALKDGRLDDAGAAIKSTNSLPAVCGRVCPQENQCEKLCVRAKMEGAVAIGACERFVGDYLLSNPQKNSSDVKPCGKKVAVIGSGPASLTCAAELCAKGVAVTVFEAFHKAGGVLTYGIPEFRLPKNLVDSEIKTLTDSGVEIKLNYVAGKTKTVKELRSEYDAVFIGSGAGLPMFMNIPGENLNGVLSANEYLTRVNLMKAYMPDSPTPVQRGKNVAVIGAGNVAMDAARTALRLGAESVSIIYRRGKEEMPARKEEIHHAEEEGIKFELLTNPIKMNGENGRVVSLECIRMRLAEPDKSGRCAPVPVENSNFTLIADMVIVALGTSPNPLIKDTTEGLETDKRGIILVDDNMQTSLDGVYAGGDAVTGAATVILAMGAGRKAAKAILDKISDT